jgi:NADP-dependent 3-hydroxy acid dehydrogenase YdfG
VSFVPAKKGATVTVAGSRGSSVLRLASTLTKAFDVDYRYLNTVLRLAAPAAVKKGEEDAGAVKFLINDAGTMLIARGAVNYVGWLATKQEG